MIELYPTLIHQRTIPYLKTLPNYNLSQYITELYLILIQYQSISSHRIKSQQKPQALKITAGAINSPRHNSYSRRWASKEKSVQRFLFQIVSQCQKWAPLPIFIHCRALQSMLLLCLSSFPFCIHYQTHSDFAQNRKVLGSQSESSTENPKIRQPIRVEYQFTKKHPRALGFSGRPFSALGSSRLSITYLITWRVFQSPT